MWIVRVHDELPAAARARRHREQTRIEEAHQRPRARESQYRFVIVPLDVFQVEPVTLHHRLDRIAASLPQHEEVDVVEQRGMYVRLPRHEPVGRERQHAFRRRLALDLLVELGQTITRQAGLGLQQLQPCAELDQFDRQGDLPNLAQHAFSGRAGVRSTRYLTHRAASVA